MFWFWLFPCPSGPGSWGLHCETGGRQDRSRHTAIHPRVLRLHAPFVSRHWVLAALIAPGCCLGLFSLTSVLLWVRTKLPITDATQLVVEWLCSCSFYPGGGVGCAHSHNRVGTVRVTQKNALLWADLLQWQETYLSFSLSVSQLLSTSHWQKSPFLQLRNAAFQNPLAESPRDLFFCSFLI